MTPVRYRIDPPIIRIHLEEPYGDAAVDALFRAVLADPAFRPGLDLLVEVPVGRNPSAEAIRERAKLLAELSPRLGRRLALVVERDVDFGLGRMFGSFVDEAGLDVRVFRDAAEAEAWLQPDGA